MGARAVALLATVLAFGLSACGLTAPRSNAGYADLDSLGPFDVDRTLSMSFGPTVLNLAARHLDHDPEIRALVKGLEGVRIRIYEIDGDAGRVFERMEHMHAKLLSNDWQSVLLVEEEGERAWMLVKASGERIVGLTVITASSHEAAVINVMGTLDPDMFNPTMAALSVDTRVEVASVN